MTPSFIGVTGLPRAGSTLLCQLLAQHPELHCDGHSSPLCNALLGIRRMVSDDQFFLSQLDNSFDDAYTKLTSAMQGFLRGWHQDCGKKAVVDKNRAWLHAIEMLLQIAPEAKLIVCIRELGQIYGSIEAQHQKTILIDFIDHLADFDRFGRADMLFAKDKAIGSPLISLSAVQDLPQEVQKRLYFLRFEDLMERPAACMSHLYAWLGVSPFEIDPEQMAVGVQESDSHYHMKYLHRQSGRIAKPKKHDIPPRIQAQIESACAWYYDLYYPKIAKPGTFMARSADKNNAVPVHQDVVWHASPLSRGTRELRNGHKGKVVWLTGLPGSGKSTIAHAVEARLHAAGMQTAVLDGDNIRHGLCADLGFSIDDRCENVRRVGEVARLFLAQGTIVFVALVSPIRSAREKIRHMLPDGDFIEVYCACPLAVCQDRDPKGLYAKAAQGMIPDFTGISSPYEAPLDAALILATGQESTDESADKLIGFLAEQLQISLESL